MRRDAVPPLQRRPTGRWRTETEARSQAGRPVPLDRRRSVRADADPVVAGLQAEFPGLRPVLFHSPYEAAVWTVIGDRIRRTQAARIKVRLAERYGEPVEVAGRTLHAFPTPSVLRRVPDQLAALANAWRPYRSWIGLLLRTRAEDRA
ncbi:hypothetical protein [Streptomyces sp. NPDC094437]|uniref:hypothetical protein n=1 Tax=Streptomyces sp. NPDC094437 TaxID=3366060 RepID=UPI003802EB62